MKQQDGNQTGHIRVMLPGGAGEHPRGGTGKTAEYAYQAATVVAALLILLTAAV